MGQLKTNIMVYINHILLTSGESFAMGGIAIIESLKCICNENFDFENLSFLIILIPNEKFELEVCEFLV